MNESRNEVAAIFAARIADTANATGESFAIPRTSPLVCSTENGGDA